MHIILKDASSFYDGVLQNIMNKFASLHSVCFAALQTLINKMLARIANSETPDQTAPPSGAV